MLTFKFNHIALSVNDVDKSFEFYRKVFHFKEIKNTTSNSKTRWLSIDGEYGIPTDYQNLSNDSRFLMMLKINLGNRESTLQRLKITQKYNRKLISAIDDYLKE